MFSKFFRLPRNKSSKFDSYLSRGARVGAPGGPTADEARRDYAAAIKSATLWRGF